MNKDLKNAEKEKILDEKFNELQEIQEENLLIDFDKAIEEYKSKPYYVKFNNKYFDVPRNMPLDFSMFFFRHCFKKVNGKTLIDVPEDKMFQFIKLMFGNDMLISLENSKKRIGIDQVFETLAMPILNKWGYGTVKNKNNNIQEKKL